MRRKRIQYVQRSSVFTEMVKICCDADYRRKSPGAAALANIGSVHSFVDAYEKRMARAARFGRMAKVAA